MTDHAEFESFVRDSLPRLNRLAVSLCRTRHEAEDLLQDALERTAIGWHRVARSDDPERYVRRIMVNRNISIWRYRRPIELSVADVPDRPFEADTVDFRDGTWMALKRLPVRQRTVLILRYCEDMSEEAIAQMMGCSRGTVKSQASKGLANLRTELANIRHSLPTPEGAE